MLLWTDTTAPYGCTWDTTTAVEGPTHTLTATAFDAAGNASTQATRTVTVKNTNDPPTVTLTAPAADSTFRKSLSFAADAMNDIGVARVEFLVDGVVRASDTTAPYAATWQVPGNVRTGPHTVTARVIDVRGSSTTTPGVTVTRVK